MPRQELNALSITAMPVRVCKYGENAYQDAALYDYGTGDFLALSKFNRIEGTEASFNNEVDLERGLQTLTHIASGWHTNWGEIPKIALAVKHGNACGAAMGRSSQTVLRKMVMGDPEAIFGGVVITNFPIDEAEARALIGYGMRSGTSRLLDSVIAPQFTDEAAALLARKKGKCRLLVNEHLGTRVCAVLDGADRLRHVRGGALRQSAYSFVLDWNDDRISCESKLVAAEKRNLLLAWAIGCTSSSNTITLVKNNMLIGNGVGQQHRGRACKLALMIAHDSGHDPEGAVAYSDSFFPFMDGPKLLHRAGVTAIFASSGSINDKRLIKYCKRVGITLAMIPDKIGRGFYGH